LNRDKSIGLVLSGGGVRGVAHLGVLKLLEEMGLRPSFISGTSAGALVGALYAAGHPINAIFEAFKETPLLKVANFTHRKPGFIDIEKFMQKLEEYFPGNSFESLKIKLFVTATDLIHGQSKTFHEGELIKPVLASCAVPVVFTPVKIGPTLYTDGGALNNFPTEPLNGRSDITIGVNVHPLKDTQAENIRSALSVMERIFHLTVHYQSVQKYHLCNVVIVPQGLAGIGTFERGRFEEIYEMGYQAALEQQDAILSALENTD
jgi:NTE family protein